MAVKTSTRKRVNGRKRVSKQNKLINVDRAVTTLKSTTSGTLSKFVQSYQAVAVFMFSFGMLTVLSIFSQGGPVVTLSSMCFSGLSVMVCLLYQYSFFTVPQYS